MMDATDRQIIEARQQGLPLVPAPYAALAETLGLPEADALDRLARLKSSGVIRRIAAAPNHFKLGMVANGMTVWDIEDARMSELGPMVGARLL